MKTAYLSFTFLLCLLSSLFFFAAFADTISPLNTVSRKNKCDDIIDGESYTTGMQKGILTTSDENINEDQQTKIICSVPNSMNLDYDTLLSISVLQKDGTISEAENKVGVASISTTLVCRNDGLWHFPYADGYPLTGKIFCEVTKATPSLPITKSTKAPTLLSTTTATTLNTCTGCNQNTLKRNLTSGLENGIVSLNESFVAGCQHLTIYCSGADPSSVTFTHLSIKSNLHKLTHLAEHKSSARVGIRIICGKNGLWYFEDYTLKFPNYVMDTILCGVKRNKSLTTTTVPYRITSTTTTPPSTTMPKTVSCDKNKKFKILSSKVDPAFSLQGKFGGLYKSRSLCKNLCNQSYGIFNCYAFMYEPKNHGKCTIFESAIDGKIPENSKSTAVVFKKCSTF